MDTDNLKDEIIDSTADDKKISKPPKQKFGVLLIFVLLLVAFIVVTIIKSKSNKSTPKEPSNDLDELESLDEELNDNSYDLYGEIKQFMNKQTSYVMSS